MLADPTYEKNEVITVQTAIKRASGIQNATYDVKLVLPLGEWFTGRVNIEFDFEKEAL
jgi:hypothetical protein